MDPKIKARLAKLEKEQKQEQVPEFISDNTIDRIRQMSQDATGNDKDYFDILFENCESELEEIEHPIDIENKPPLIVCFHDYHGEGIEETFRHKFVIGIPNSTLYQKKQEDGTWTPWQTYKEMYPPDQINGTLPELEPTNTTENPRYAEEIEEEARNIINPTEPDNPRIQDIDLKVQPETSWSIDPKY
jgi:hypothetical protein